jgi:hypothetical protein
MPDPMDISLGFGHLDLRKTANNVLLKCLDFVQKALSSTIETSPNQTAETVLENSLKQFIPAGITPEVADYLSRNTLRAIVGLPPIQINATDKDAIRKLKGSVSWLSKEKINVTDIIREMREC